MTAAGGHIVVGHKTDDPLRAQVITALVEGMTSREWQTDHTRKASVATRNDVPPSDELMKGEDLVVWLAQEVGILDVGFPNSWYYETRSAGPEVLRPLLLGEIDAEEAAKLYYDMITEIINK